MRRGMLLFDRDGVLNQDLGYVGSKEAIRWVEGARESIALARRHGLVCVVATNQSGIARGYFDHLQFERLIDWMDEEFRAFGGHLDAVFYCPYLRFDGSTSLDCRKPAPGMVLYALRTFGVDPEHAVLFGDADRDLEAARAASVRAIRYTGGNLLELVEPEIERLVRKLGVPA